jgi:cyclohexanone monooxygenase
VPWLARSVKKLYVVQRTPNAVGARPNPPTDPEWFEDLEPGWQMARFENFALQTSGVPVEEDLIQDGWSAIFYDLIKPGQDESLSREDRAAAAKLADLQKMEKLRQRVDDLVEDADLAARLKPYYHYLCKRPGFHDEYLQSFNRPNVELIDTGGRGVERITPTGLVVDGVAYDVDCMVYATGFLTADDPYTTRAGFEVIGAGGVSLGHKWKDGPETFQGVMSHGFPNLVIFPDASQQAVTSFNFMHTLVESSAHAAYIISALDSRGAASFDVDPDAERSWIAAVVEHAHDRDAFFNACTPGRFSNEGHVAERSNKAASYPLKTMDFFALWHAWRDAGELSGLVLHPRTAKGKSAPA